MKIETKYNIGQKVYYIGYGNQPAYGRIKSMKINVESRGFCAFYKVDETSDVWEEHIFEKKEDLENYFVEQVKKSIEKELGK